MIVGDPRSICSLVPIPSDISIKMKKDKVTADCYRNYKEVLTLLTSFVDEILLLLSAHLLGASRLIEYLSLFRVGIVHAHDSMPPTLLHDTFSPS